MANIRRLSKRHQTSRTAESTTAQLADEYAANALEVVLEATPDGLDMLRELSTSRLQRNMTPTAMAESTKSQPTAITTGEAELDGLRLRIGRQRKRLQRLQTEQADTAETKWLLGRLFRQAAVLEIHLDTLRPGALETADTRQGEHIRWARRYGVLPEALSAAIAAHGPDLDAVDAALGGPPPIPVCTETNGPSTRWRR